MGFTQGKRPSGAKIGKVHKIMSGNTVVFRDATSSLDDLIARAQENPVHLMLADVTIEEPGHPIELAAPAGSLQALGARCGPR